MNKDVTIEIAQCAFESRLASCSTVAECWTALTTEFAARGIPHMSYGGLFAPHYRTDVSKEMVYLTSHKAEFITHYGAEDHLRHDVCILWPFQFMEAVSWRAPQLLSGMNERQKRVYCEGNEFGVRNGLSVPVRFGRERNPGCVILSATGMNDREWDDTLRGHGDLFVALAQTFHEFVSHFPLFAEPVSPYDKVVRLTQRERECLTWAARGCQVGEVADRLNVADRTAEHHLASARSKLRARTTAQAVVKALAMGMLHDRMDGFKAKDGLWESAIPGPNGSH
jgi:LuxR family transcriptional activator of conjugal transfer of Ti plasmids